MYLRGYWLGLLEVDFGLQPKSQTELFWFLSYRLKSIYVYAFGLSCDIYHNLIISNQMHQLTQFNNQFTKWPTMFTQQSVCNHFSTTNIELSQAAFPQPNQTLLLVPLENSNKLCIILTIYY